MALVSLPRSFMFPDTPSTGSFSPAATMDAAGEKLAMMGRLHIEGRPAGTKTLSTGTIGFRTGTCTFSDGGSTLDIGIQGVASASGPIAQPNGSFSVKKTLTGGAGITSNAWNTATMDSGTVDLAHGDICAVVFDMTARGGSDSVIVKPINGAVGSGFLPMTNVYVAGAWQTTQTLGAGNAPNVIITFDDGTLGWFDFTIPMSDTTNEGFVDTTNPDERGLIFQVPFDCKIDGLFAFSMCQGANSDSVLNLYSDPTGTPSLLASVTDIGEQSGSSGSSGYHIVNLPSEVSLSKNTNYGVTIKATGSSNVILWLRRLDSEAHRITMNGGTTLAKITRNNSTGAFTAETPAVTMYEMGVRVSQIDDGAGSGGGGSGPFRASPKL